MFNGTLSLNKKRTVVKREIKIRHQQHPIRPRYVAKPTEAERESLIPQLEFPAIQWILKDWGAWTRSLPEFSPVEQPLDMSYCREEWYINDDHAFALEKEIKRLEKYNGFMKQCISSYYLTRNMTTRELASRKNISKARLLQILRTGEGWLHCASHEWVEPLHQEYLAWQVEKDRRQKIYEEMR